MNQVTRLTLLRGRLRETESPVRPPWARGEADFLDLCDRCGACRDACAPGIVGRGSGGFPEVDFRQGGCTFCGGCADRCRTGALARGAAAATPPWRLRATVGDGCLARGGVLCRACGSACETGAIRFPPAAGAIAPPVIAEPDCSGCGACVAACPAGSAGLRVTAPPGDAPPRRAAAGGRR